MYSTVPPAGWPGGSCGRAPEAAASQATTGKGMGTDGVFSSARMTAGSSGNCSRSASGKNIAAADKQYAGDPE
ncbi:MAG: hypothetical protein ACLUS6_15940 [Dysosmobacter sp.]